MLSNLLSKTTNAISFSRDLHFDFHPTFLTLNNVHLKDKELRVKSLATNEDFKPHVRKGKDAYPSHQNSHPEYGSRRYTRPYAPPESR